jgi:hypothetical protein
MKTILALITLALVTFATQAAPVLELKQEPRMSVETLAAIRSVNIGDGEQYGAGLGLGYKFNSYVTGWARALAYETDNWRGSTIDEASLLVEARLFNSGNGSFRLAAIGGADRDFDAQDWGFSVGLRAGLSLTPNLGLVAESRIRAWFDQEKDLISTAGLAFSF